ncbi:Predicted metal-dependent peptidase [Butyrivibrio sp. ob235]|uniref:vWA domain-containing protein n=1 Tax=Butyrivibrio sp. ob235 TaxID=1761780 RepID=UPI0008B4EF97|nr:hypothetical protein [Butyrivibrio sp. ob235]SEM39278.1 Predicted metal-dependent peptidase [Butyrivibrio sp. ob235]
MAKQHEKKISQNEKQLRAGYDIVTSNDIFGLFAYRRVGICGKEKLGKKTAACSYADGEVLINKDFALSPRQWAYAIAHCLLHNCFGHYDLDKVPGYMVEDFNGEKTKKASFDPKLWNIACDIYVDKFLHDIKFGDPVGPDPVGRIPQGIMTDEVKIYEYLIREGWDEDNHIYGVGAPDVMDMVGLDKPIEYKADKWGYQERNEFAADFAVTISCAVRGAVSKVSGQEDNNNRYSVGKRAAEWFINCFPLLGALAASFKIIEDINICHENDIRVAAVNAWDGEIYINTSAHLSEEEWKFVLAHEFLHAALMHHQRCEGRDHYLWNIATDYVINGWLFEMNVGSMPADVLYDEKLKNKSAEEIYDLILSDMRTYMKLNTFRGNGKGDILGKTRISGSSRGVSLDDFYRNALAQGLEYEEMRRGRGFIPAGLVEEIRALAVPPIPWDVRLAEWFNAHIRPLEKHRSYAHPSRRQSCTPDIPRARYVVTDSDDASRTFGVIIDTSGSMDPKEIGKALGAVASYAAAREVPAARVVFCDANAYDAGYMTVDEIAGRVNVIGRGGTKLQPAVNLLQNAKDFPKDGPILIITDGWIEEHLDIKRTHAYILPSGCRLPFKARGDVFYM